jgi:D-serine deaminase-like pyridoxal phosphate-dependent protein
MATTELYPLIDTPAVLIDLDKMEANLGEMAEVARSSGVKLRPHIKTHKSVELARLQLSYGASGVTVAKLGEAEVMADAGIRDVRIAYPIVGELKLRRLRTLAERCNVSLALDSAEVAEGISRLGCEMGIRFNILLKINTGLNRTGVLPGESSVHLAHRLNGLKGVTLVGILTHEGHVVTLAHNRAEVREQSMQVGRTMVQTRDLLMQAGMDILEVSVGSTPSARDIAGVPGVTEIRPGTYIFNDVNEMGSGVASEDTCAATVLVTVVSVPSDDRVIIDAGSKVLSSDRIARPGCDGYGRIKGQVDVQIDRLNEEHGMLSTNNAVARFRVGQRLEVIPNHVCPVVNLTDWLWGVRKGRVERKILVDARGRSV